jgi:hypothetical protein
MTNHPKPSPVEIFAEMGHLLAKLCTDRLWAVIIVILAWLFNPIGGLATTLLIVSIYARSRRAPDEPFTIDLTIQPKTYLILVIIGSLLVVIGLEGLVSALFPRFPWWPAMLIALGGAMVLLGMARRSGDE